MDDLFKLSLTDQAIRRIAAQNPRSRNHEENIVKALTMYRDGHAPEDGDWVRWVVFDAIHRALQFKEPSE